MLLKLLILFTCVSSFEFSRLSQHCSKERSLHILQRSTYDFSVRLLHRVLQDTNGHFVFSPLATWGQLAALAEGAKGHTFQEIRNVTKHHVLLCLKRKWRAIVNVMLTELKPELRMKSVMVIDKLLSVKHRFLADIEQSNNMEVLLYNFANGERAAMEANKIIDNSVGQLSEVLFPQDFNSTTLLTVDIMLYKSAWKYAFNRAYTASKPFYSENGAFTTQVDMMKTLGYFNVSDIPMLNTKMLELPCGADDRLSLLIFLPDKGESIWNFYFRIWTRKFSIFRQFKRDHRKLVNIELPRFNITTDLDNIPELIYDMGAKMMFDPLDAEFGGISDYPVYTSLMTQTSQITVNEEGVEANVIAENMISDGSAIDFIVDKPFLYMLVDKKFELILFAGAYTNPSLN